MRTAKAIWSLLLCACCFSEEAIGDSEYESGSETGSESGTATGADASTNADPDTGENASASDDSTSTSSSTNDAASESAGDSASGSSETNDTNAIADVYAAFSDALAWYDASAFCTDRGGELASALDEPQNAAIHVVCGATPGGAGPDTGCWIGLRAPYETWENGSAVEFENWAPEQPSTDDGCVWLYLQSAFGEPAQWDDTPCSWSTSFVCRLPAGADVSDAAATILVP